MFPTANSEIYRNEEGEVLGWDTYSYDEADAYYEDMYDYGYGDWPATEDCDHGDGDGVGETEDGTTIWECGNPHCEGVRYYFQEEDTMTRKVFL